jgi:hypothetical protein
VSARLAHRIRGATTEAYATGNDSQLPRSGWEGSRRS